MLERPIKFRAWDTPNERWLTTSFLVREDGAILSPYDGGRSVERNVILEQFTGLLDKNRKEIYEGDIVQTYRRSSSNGTERLTKDFRGVVEYADYYFGLRELSHVHGGHFLSSALEVVGNIHQNPDLLP